DGRHDGHLKDAEIAPVIALQVLAHGLSRQHEGADVGLALRRAKRDVLPRHAQGGARGPSVQPALQNRPNGCVAHLLASLAAFSINPFHSATVTRTMPAGAWLDQPYSTGIA